MLGVLVKKTKEKKTQTKKQSTDSADIDFASERPLLTLTFFFINPLV